MRTTTSRSAPEIARDQWPSHPHYPAQVLLLGSHENFRRVSEYLIAEAQARADIGPIESLFRRWISGMRSHEAYEEYKLYPFLSMRWGASFDAAEEGHRTLHARYDDVIAAFTQLRDNEVDEESREALVDALRRHDVALREHLIVEEELVIPMLLSLRPEEFDFYSRSSLSTLVRAYSGHGEP